jgi:hypothetical protein
LLDGPIEISSEEDEEEDDDDDDDEGGLFQVDINNELNLAIPRPVVHRSLQARSAHWAIVKLRPGLPDGLFSNQKS